MSSNQRDLCGNWDNHGEQTSPQMMKLSFVERCGASILTETPFDELSSDTSGTSAVGETRHVCQSCLHISSFSS